MTQRGLSFNHAMIYTQSLAASLEFYRDKLGFRLLETYPGAYARLECPAGGATIALHVLEPGKTMKTASEGVRLYFEVEDLEGFCRDLEKQGTAFDQPPKRMPWGWQHAYLRDPDGHEISLYWAGEARTRASG